MNIQEIVGSKTVYSRPYKTNTSEHNTINGNSTGMERYCTEYKALLQKRNLRMQVQF